MWAGRRPAFGTLDNRHEHKDKSLSCYTQPQPAREIAGGFSIPGAELLAEVHKFEPKLVGEGFRFEADTILEKAKGRGFTNVLIIGELEGGEFWISSAANAGEALILMGRAKHKIVFGDD